jgi:hypothetical protein
MFCIGTGVYVELIIQKEASNIRSTKRLVRLRNSTALVPRYRKQSIENAGAVSAVMKKP